MGGATIWLVGKSGECMSQTETLMLVLLGFAAASFLALVIGRSLWKLARAIHRRRHEHELPATVAALKADRDRLRAESAMLARKFDVRIADLKAKVVEQAAEVSRHRNRLEMIAADARKREEELAGREAETSDMREQLMPLETELAARTQTIQELERFAKAREETIARLNREIADLRAVIADRDRALVESERMAERRSLQAPAAIAPEMLTAQERVTRRIAELTALSQQIASQREQFTEERDKFSALRQAIALPAPPAPASEEPLDRKHPREQIDAIDEHGKAIEEKLIAAERESEALAGELRSLDAAWTKKIEELDAAMAPPPPASEVAAANENGEGKVEASQATAEPEEDEPRQRAAGNVVSLASRIKALQRDATR